jgi:ribosome-binding factor A
MPEHRGRKHHQDRVAETLREEIGVLIGVQFNSFNSGHPAVRAIV